MAVTARGSFTRGIRSDVIGGGILGVGAGYSCVYLLATLRHYFPHARPRIHPEFGGVRVLLQGDGRAFHRTRDCDFHVDEAHPRLASLYGAKLTGYRSTDEDVMAKVRQALGPCSQVVNTATLRLPEPA